MQYIEIIDIIRSHFKNNASCLRPFESDPITERDDDLGLNATFRPIKFSVEGYKFDHIEFNCLLAQLKYEVNTEPSVEYAYSHVAKMDDSIRRYSCIEDAYKATSFGKEYLGVLRSLSDIVKTHGSDAIFMSSNKVEDPAISIFFKSEGMLVMLNFKKK